MDAAGENTEHVGVIVRDANEHVVGLDRGV